MYIFLIYDFLICENRYIWIFIICLHLSINNRSYRQIWTNGEQLESIYNLKEKKRIYDEVCLILFFSRNKMFIFI